MRTLPPKRILIPGLCLLLALTPRSAHAQSINYASLESLFGEPVTTSATGSPQKVSEAPVAMEIVTADDIRRSGAKDIAEVLRSVSGVSVLQSARQDYDVNIRGYNQAYSPNLLVLVNGRQVYLDDYGYTAWSTIPVQLEEIRQIEVVKGPNTALFGFNAADGVINIITYNPLYDDKADAGVTGGTGEYRDAHVVKTFKAGDDFGIRLSAGASKADEFGSPVNGADPFSVFTPPEKQEANLDSIVQLTDKSQLRLEASTGRSQQTEETTFNILSKAKYITNALKADYEADTGAGLIKATVYNNWLNMDYHGDQYDPAVFTDIQDRTLVAQLEDTFKLGLSHTFRLQGEYRHSDAQGLLVGPDGADIQDNIYAASAMWSWAITPKWELTNSARIDRLELSRSGPSDPFSPLVNADFDQMRTVPSYNSGLVWKATPDDSFRLNAARGVRMASTMDFGVSLRMGAQVCFPGPVCVPALQVGNPEIQPTVVTDYELGWNHNIRAINGMFKADVFTGKTTDVEGGQNVIGTPLTPPNNPAVVLQGGNVGWSETVGAEVGLKGKFGKNWTWDVNDTVQRIHDHYTDPSVDNEDTSPVNTANFHLGYAEGPWETDGFVYVVSPFKQYNPGLDITAPQVLDTVPAQASVSGRIGYRIDDRMTVAVSGQQLQAAHTTTSGGPDTDRRIFVSLDSGF